MNNEPAFPTYHGGNSKCSTDGCGMTLRDYFAAKAMQSLATVAPKEWHEAYEDDPQYLPMIKGVSLIAYQFADEMIKARKTGEGK